MASTSIRFPRQDIPQKDKTERWLKDHLDYAESILNNYGSVKQRMDRFFEGYNGIKQPGSMEWLTKTYGLENRSKFVSYRLGRVKIDLLHGEWLKRPLAATVTTIDSNSVNEKLDQRNFVRGAMLAKDEIETVKQLTGADPTNGMRIPEDESEFEKMTFKDQWEDVAQIILDNQMIELDVRKKLGDGFKNCEITSHTFGQIERTVTGDIEFHNIDPRDAIYESVYDDDYLEKSPIMGCRKRMPVHEVLNSYELTQEQRNMLDTARLSPNAYVGPTGRGRGFMTLTAGELLCDIIHIVWKSVRPMYIKIVPKTESQLLLDETETTLEFEMDTEKYEKNKEFHDANEVKGLYKVVTKFMEDEYEATRIGGLIDVNMRRTFLQKRSVDNPSRILNSTYVGYVHGRVDGITVPLQQMIENFDNLYDIIKYQQAREIAKSKGKVLTIDKAGIGVNQTLKDTYYRMSNDQVLEYDSSAAGNLGNRNLDPSMMFREFDMGLSQSFQSLLMVEQSIINSLNQITGINENRQGITAASSTATAQQSDIANSRTITEALFYGYSGYVKRVVKAILDASALSWAYYKQGKAEQILGTDRFSFLRNAVDLAYKDYGVYIEDGTKNLEISQKLDMFMQVSLNSGQLHVLDAMKVSLAETLVEKKNFLQQSLERSQAIAQDQMQQEQQAQAQIAQQQMATQIQIAQENREDMQASDIEKINAKEAARTQAQIAIDTNKAQLDRGLLGLKTQSEIISNMELPPNQ